MPGRFKTASVRAAWALAGLFALLLVGRDFFQATAFLGDDYIFLAYARLEPSLFSAFTRDKHGGEYYRPIPMLLWGLVDTVAGGRSWPFASVAFALHLVCAGLVAGLARTLGLRWRTAGIAGGLFFVAPAEREAALWFSASTDLLASAAVLATVSTFLSRRWRWASPAFAAVGFWCKESALVLPLLLLAADWFTRPLPPQASFGRCLKAVLPHTALALLYLGTRFFVLHGWGGTNDPPAPAWGRMLQLASGLVHAVTAYAPWPEALAWLAGAPAIALAAALAWRQSPLARVALAWLLLTLLPLPAAGWVVGARYFYLPSVGLMLLLALALERLPAGAAPVALLALLGLGLPVSVHRRGEIGLYRAAVGAAAAGICDGVASGHRSFLVRGAVKDLDLAIKLATRAPLSPAPDYVVLADVPASFLWLPPALEPQLRFLLADPPLPPSGAYRFGGERIVGQARRDEGPDLDQIFEHLPELRIIHLRRSGPTYTWEDRTADYRR